MSFGRLRKQKPGRSAQGENGMQRDAGAANVAFHSKEIRQPRRVSNRHGS